MGTQDEPLEKRVSARLEGPLVPFVELRESLNVAGLFREAVQRRLDKSSVDTRDFNWAYETIQQADDVRVSEVVESVQTLREFIDYATTIEENDAETTQQH